MILCPLAINFVELFLNNQCTFLYNSYVISKLIVLEGEYCGIKNEMKNLKIENSKIWPPMNYSSCYKHFQLALLIDIDTKIILCMGKLTRSNLELSSHGKAT